MTVLVKKSDLAMVVGYLTDYVSNGPGANLDKGDPMRLSLGMSILLMNEFLSGGATLNESSIIKIKEDYNARREESIVGEVPGHISGTDEQNQGNKDGQEKVAPDSAD